MNVYQMDKYPFLRKEEEFLKNAIEEFSWGLQFHSEVTYSMIKEWLNYYKGDLAGKGIDENQLLTEYLRIKDVYNRAAELLYGNFLRSVKARLRI